MRVYPSDGSLGGEVSGGQEPRLEVCGRQWGSRRELCMTSKPNGVEGFLRVEGARKVFAGRAVTPAQGKIGTKQPG